MEHNWIHNEQSSEETYVESMINENIRLDIREYRSGDVLFEYGSDLCCIGKQDIEHSL